MFEKPITEFKLPMLLWCSQPSSTMLI